MKHTFYLKKPSDSKLTLIYFSCYFKLENKKFVYSTGEKILPNNWDKSNNRPFMKGKNKAVNSNSIQIQLDRYSHKFQQLIETHTIINEEFNSSTLKNEFDKEFKKETTRFNHFFDTYNQFLEYNKKMNSWAGATLKKYETLEKILLEFEQVKKYTLTFSKINDIFLSEFTDFCYTNRGHNTNTFRRNLGLFKTFMNWSFTRKFTYNSSYMSFQKPKAIIPKMFSLSLDEVKSIFLAEIESEKLVKIRDTFVLQCLTGLRYNELPRINKATIKGSSLHLKETKDLTKQERIIPLAEIALNIIKKYDYNIPAISNQKYNDYIKDVVAIAGINYEVEVPIIRGKKQEFVKVNIADKISSHSARSSFITNMKNKGIPDKTIMSMTGHRDLKTFLTYYRVNDVSTYDAVQKVFGNL